MCVFLRHFLIPTRLIAQIREFVFYFISNFTQFLLC